MPCTQPGIEIVAVYTQPDRPAGRGRTLSPSPVKRRALELGLPIEQPPTLRTPDAVAGLKAHSPDLMVVVAYGLILPQTILDVPRLGCLNIHASLLPRWRGAAPIQRAILAGDTRTGVTIMQMDAGLDTGPMLLVRPVEIGADENAGGLHDRLAALGAEAIVTAIDALAEGRAVPVAQPLDGSTYAAKISKQEALDRLEPQRGRNRPAGERLQSLAGGRDSLAGAAAADLGSAAAAGGSGVRRRVPSSSAARRDRLLIAAGGGCARGSAGCSSPGRNAMSAAEFLNAHALGAARLG